MSSKEEAFTFIDLFCGVGGFHAALSGFGGKCVYAVEIDKKAAAVYEKNWGLNPLGDITLDANDDVMNVPKHDILVAGFPCQPFSKSGTQKGMEETRGTLFWNILKIIQEHKPTIVMLENVRNLAGPRHIHEWEVIIKSLRDEGYRVALEPVVFSPHLLPTSMGGRPQSRERVFITATYNPKGIGENIDVAPPIASNKPVLHWNPKEDCSIMDFLEESTLVTGCDLTTNETLWVDAWDDFTQKCYSESDNQPPNFPIWADSWVDVMDVESDVYKNFLASPNYETILKLSPLTPKWKAMVLAKNYVFYLDNETWLTEWLNKWEVFSDKFPPSRRKLEWQAQGADRLWNTVMHFRPSGIRAKKVNYLPTLVAIAQTSIIGPLKRRISPREAARLQGLPDWFDFAGQPDASTYKQMGNGVNVGAVWYVLREHVKRDVDVLNTTHLGRKIKKSILDSPSSPDVVIVRDTTAAIDTSL